MGPESPEEAQDGAKMGPRWAQDGSGSPKQAQDGPKMGPRRAQDGPKMAPNRSHGALEDGSRKKATLNQSAPPHLSHFGALLGLSWGPLGGLGGPLGATLEDFDQKGEGSSIRVPPWSPKNRLLGPSWDALGALLRPFGPLWEPLWAPIGALLGDIKLIFKPQKPIGSEKAIR